MQHSSRQAAQRRPHCGDGVLGLEFGGEFETATQQAGATRSCTSKMAQADGLRKLPGCGVLGRLRGLGRERAAGDAIGEPLALIARHGGELHDCIAADRAARADIVLSQPDPSKHALKDSTR